MPRSMRFTRPIGILVLVALLGFLASLFWTASPVWACDDENLSKQAKLLKRLKELEKELAHLRAQAERISGQVVTEEGRVVPGEVIIKGSDSEQRIQIGKFDPNQTITIHGDGKIIVRKGDGTEVVERITIGEDGSEIIILNPLGKRIRVLNRREQGARSGSPGIFQLRRGQPGDVQIWSIGPDAEPVVIEKRIKAKETLSREALEEIENNVIRSLREALQGLPNSREIESEIRKALQRALQETRKKRAETRRRGRATVGGFSGGLLTLPRQQTLGLVPYSTLRAKLSSDGCCCSGCCVRSVGEGEGGSFFQIQRQQDSSRKNSKGKSSKGSSSKNRGKSSKAKKHDPTVLWAQPGTPVVRSSLNHH